MYLFRHTDGRDLTYWPVSLPLPRRLNFLQGEGLIHADANKLAPKEGKRRDVPVAVGCGVVPVAIEASIIGTIVTVTTQQQETTEPGTVRVKAHIVICLS